MTGHRGFSMFALAFPSIDPTLIEIGPFAIRWYALAYIGGIVFGWRYAIVLARRSPATIDRRTVDDFLIWVTLGIVLGGRIGYVLFYKPGYFFAHPLEILQLWQGGMAFHGGLLGVIIAVIWFARLRHIATFALGDIVCSVVPIGLCLGRLANFVNGELFGRVTDVPWAVIFPNGGPEPRHPSQLYEAGLEGLVLGLVLFAAWRLTDLRLRPGAITGLFLLGYGLARFTVELFREPDAHLGFLFAGATMGQLLSAPMILIGLALLIWARPYKAPPEPAKPAQQGKPAKRKR